MSKKKLLLTITFVFLFALLYSTKTAKAETLYYDVSLGVPTAFSATSSQHIRFYFETEGREKYLKFSFTGMQLESTSSYDEPHYYIYSDNNYEIYDLEVFYKTDTEVYAYMPAYYNSLSIKISPGCCNYSGYLTITDVTKYVSKIKFKKKKTYMSLDQTKYMKYSVSPKSADYDCYDTFTSSNLTVASVDSSGYVTAKSFGEATIALEDLYSGKKAKTKIIVNKGTKNLLVGKSISKNSLIPHSGKCKWKSSDSSVVRISGSKLDVLKQGIATVTCKVKGENYTIKIYADTKEKMKKAAVSELKKNLLNPKSLQIHDILYDHGSVTIEYSAQNMLGGYTRKYYVVHFKGKNIVRN